MSRTLTITRKPGSQDVVLKFTRTERFAYRRTVCPECGAKLNSLAPQHRNAQACPGCDYVQGRP